MTTAGFLALLQGFQRASEPSGSSDFPIAPLLLDDTNDSQDGSDSDFDMSDGELAKLRRYRTVDIQLPQADDIDHSFKGLCPYAHCPFGKLHSILSPVSPCLAQLLLRHDNAAFGGVEPWHDRDICRQINEDQGHLYILQRLASSGKQYPTNPDFGHLPLRIAKYASSIIRLFTCAALVTQDPLYRLILGAWRRMNVGDRRINLDCKRSSARISEPIPSHVMSILSSAG